MAINQNRPDHNGIHRGPYERNKKKILATQSICGICGKPVDKSIRYPHPLSPVVDHIVPIAKGGHPSDPDNLQLAHWGCNRQKSDKLVKRHVNAEEQIVNNRNLPLSCDWTAYRADQDTPKPESPGYVQDYYGQKPRGPQKG